MCMWGCSPNQNPQALILTYLNQVGSFARQVLDKAVNLQEAVMRLGHGTAAPDK